MGSSTHTTGTDAWVTSLKPGAGFPVTTALKIQSPGTATEYSFCRTNNPIPRGATPTLVRLHLFGVGNWGASVTVTVKRITAKWTDSLITYNTIPSVAAAGAVSVTQTNPADGTEWIFDLTTMWQSIANGTNPNYGLRIETSSTTERKFYSFDSIDEALRPTWEFLWSDAPDAPTGLVPSGGASVSLQKPTLVFNFYDVSGNTDMASCRVQINPTNTYVSDDPVTGGFASPAFDTGEFATTDPELDTSGTFPQPARTVGTTSASANITGTFTSADVGATIVGTGIPASTTILSQTGTAAVMSANATATGSPSVTITRSYAGLAIGATAWWAVQVKDGAGIWSNWSDPVKFTRVAKGTLAINSPTGGVITDPTQQIIWTLTGVVQNSYRVTVADNANPTKYLYDTGRRNGSTNNWTIPKGIITDESITYRVTVRTWDDLTRTATPNDTIFTEAVATFTFQSSGTADTVTGLTVSPRANGQPGLVISWQRATAPDYYEVRRGTPGAMTVLDTDLNPADLIVSGTTYQYIDRTALANNVHTYRVVTKAAGVIKYSGTANGSFTLLTTWLEDVSAGKMVPIVYRDGTDSIGSFDAPQIAVVNQPLRASRVVRVTQGQAGLQGSVSGVIIDMAGDTADNWRKNLEWMRDRPSNVVRLSTQGFNLAVVIGDVVISPYKQSMPGSRVVSFNFWQQ